MSSIHPQAWLFKPSQAQAGMQTHKLGKNRAGWLGQNQQGFGSPLNFVYILLCPPFYCSFNYLAVLRNMQYFEILLSLPLHSCKVGRHGGRRKIKEVVETPRELLPMENFEGVHPLNNKYLPFIFLVLPWPFSCAVIVRVRKIWQPEKGERSYVLRYQRLGGAVQWVDYRLARPAYTTTTVWSPSPTSSRLPLISPCASQSMPLMCWCPSFAYSIFDLSHFIQLNPAEVDSHRQDTPSFLPVLPPLSLSCSFSCSAKWPPNWPQKITFLSVM